MTALSLFLFHAHRQTGFAQGTVTWVGGEGIPQIRLFFLDSPSPGDIMVVGAMYLGMFLTSLETYLSISNDF